MYHLIKRIISKNMSVTKENMLNTTYLKLLDHAGSIFYTCTHWKKFDF